MEVCDTHSGASRKLIHLAINVGPGSAGPGRGGGPVGPSAPPLSLPAAVIPDRLVNNELDNVIKGLSKIKIQGGGGELPIRPGFGTLGKAIKLRANYFPIQTFPRSLFEYDVQVSALYGSLTLTPNYCIDKSRDQSSSREGTFNDLWPYDMF